jgi:hypothetical protein
MLIVEVKLTAKFMMIGDYSGKARIKIRGVIKISDRM